MITARGHLPNTTHVLVHEGDEDRRVQVTIGVAGAPDTSEAEEQTEAPPKANEATTAPGNGRIASVVVGALGLVGIGIGTGFGAAASSAWNASQRECVATRPTVNDKFGSPQIAARPTNVAFVTAADDNLTMAWAESDGGFASDSHLVLSEFASP